MVFVTKSNGQLVADITGKDQKVLNWMTKLNPIKFRLSVNKTNITIKLKSDDDASSVVDYLGKLTDEEWNEIS